MIYILFGENISEINKYIEKLIKENHIETKVTYDYNETKIEDVIEEAGYLDLFGNNKIIVLNDSTFLTSKSTLENKTFENYISNPNPSTFLVLKVITDKLDERKKIVKTLKEKAKIIEFKNLEEKEIEPYIKKYLEEKDYKIDTIALKEISKRLKSNTKVLDKELEKLIIYKYEDKRISLEDVEKVIIKYEENNIFKLVEAVIKKNKKEIFKLYKSLIDNKEEPTVILVLLANQFRLLLQIKILLNDGLDKYEISKKLGEHSYRVTLGIEEQKNITKEELIKILKELSNIDIEIKSGLIDKVKALEMFFIQL